MLRPMIGITVAHYNEELETFPREYYVRSIRLAGGIPLLIPPVSGIEEGAEVLRRLDGLLLSGGGDISPIYLGELPVRGIKESFPQRDDSEITLVKQALDRDVPLLGICRGIQVMAVAAGGKIYQDIPSQYPSSLEHSQTAPREYPWHEVELSESLLYNIIKERKISVNSLHHQAVSALPQGFVTSAKAPDGVIEGIERPQAKFCLGVQWHPESMGQEIHSKALFASFVKACNK
ncbi:MAG: gamma-glutamyl-gamma-aminobutyrate hydrolase family protein [Desulfitobacteriaceae bacterium]